MRITDPQTVKELNGLHPDTFFLDEVNHLTIN